MVNHETYFNPFLFQFVVQYVADPVYAFVQPARQMSFAKVVRVSDREKQKEDYPRIDRQYSDTKAKNVLLFRVEGSQNCL